MNQYHAITLFHIVNHNGVSSFSNFYNLPVESYLLNAYQSAFNIIVYSIQYTEHQGIIVRRRLSVPMSTLGTDSYQFGTTVIVSLIDKENLLIQLPYEYTAITFSQTKKKM